MAPAVQNLISGYILWPSGTGLFMAYNHQVDCMEILLVEHLNTHFLRAEGVNVCHSDRADTSVPSFFQRWTFPLYEQNLCSILYFFPHPIQLIRVSSHRPFSPSPSLSYWLSQLSVHFTILRISFHAKMMGGFNVLA